MKERSRRGSPHLASLGAFPFPLPQGSQVFVREQALALERAGASVTLVCYGRGTEPPPEGLTLRRTPAALSPRSLRAGPSPAKPVADAALLAAYVAAHRRERFDLALAHNVEGAAVALAARPAVRVPVIYVAHTLMRHELASYGPAALRPALDRIGRALDDGVARRADAVIALCEASAAALGAHARGPVAVIPPGLTPAPPPSDAEIARVCVQHGLEREGFALYAGNPDGYQDLDALARAARQLRELPIAVATHATPPPVGSSPGGSSPLRWISVADAREARALLHGARVALLPRRSPGGFPVKLLNYMEAARPIVAREGLVAALVHGVNAQLVPAEAPAADFAAAIRALLSDPDRARRLGAAARATLEARHAWPDLARRTLELAAGAVAAGRSPHPSSAGAGAGEPDGSAASSQR